MKKNIALFLFLLATAGATFAQPAKKISSSTYLKCTSFHITKPLRELANAEMKTSSYKEDIGDIRQAHPASGFVPKNSYPPDPCVQQNPGTLTLDTPLVNFEGGNWAYRPDANGAAGPNHYVQGVNLCNYNIYDKTGNLLLATDMSVLGGGCSDDPIVMYDKFADRWVVTDVTYNYNNLSIAVSTSGDPTGSYYVYTFAYPVMPDFPKYSVWTDGYYATYRDINNDTVGISVLERNRMLMGDPNAGIIIAKFPNGAFPYKICNKNSQLPGSPKILTCDGALPPYGTPAYLMYYTNVNMGDASNSIMIYKLVTDTLNKTCAITFVDSLATAAYNGYFAGYSFGGNIAEPGGQQVWSLEGPFQFRAPYLRFTGYNSVVLCNTVNLGGMIAGVRWYELRQNDTTKVWSIYQQSTFGPSDGISRWNSSICMDLNGDISIAYNVTNSSSLYPGIRYTGRLASDPLNTMTFAEQTAMTGTHSFSQQWGDICESTLDPDGITFWHTNQYIIDPSGNTANVRIFSYQLTSTLNNAAADVPKNQAELTAFCSDNQLNVLATGLTSAEPVVINLFDINGKELFGKWLTPVSNRLEHKINVEALAKGTYFVRIGNARFQKVCKVVI
ncbi:MAG: T9SS type A sorting domain-containing protein [Bacteroidetes bacterium]|nr:T9SS type A sorting domain-containing protein [Bacteroidota bacterium]